MHIFYSKIKINRLRRKNKLKISYMFQFFDLNNFNPNTHHFKLEKNLIIIELFCIHVTFKINFSLRLKHEYLI